MKLLKQALWIIAFLGGTSVCLNGNNRSFALAFSIERLQHFPFSVTGRTRSTLYARGAFSSPPPPPPPPSAPRTAVVDETNLFSDIIRNIQDTIPTPTTTNVNLDSMQDYVRNSDQFLPPTLDIRLLVENIRNQIDTLDKQILAELNEVATQLQRTILDQEQTPTAEVKLVFEKLSEFLQPFALSPTATILVSAVLSYLSVNALLTWGRPPSPSQPYPLGKYDPIAARNYFDHRFPQVLARSLTIFAQSLQFGIDLLRDKLGYVYLEQISLCRIYTLP